MEKTNPERDRPFSTPPATIVHLRRLPVTCTCFRVYACDFGNIHSQSGTQNYPRVQRHVRGELREREWGFPLKHTRIRQDKPAGPGDEVEEAVRLLQRRQQPIVRTGYHQSVNPGPHVTPHHAQSRSNFAHRTNEVRRQIREILWAYS